VVSIVTGVAAAHVSSGAMRNALEDYMHVLALAAEAGELARIAAHDGRGFSLFYLGEFRASRDAFDCALAIFDPERHDSLAAGFQDDEGVTLLGWSAWCDWFLGFPDRAWRAAGDARSLAARRRHPASIAFADAWASVTASFRGDWENTIALGEAAASLAAQQGLPLLEAVGGMSRAFAVGFSSGDPTAYEQWLMRAAGTGNQAGAPWILGNLADLQLRAKRLDVADQVLAGALAVAEQTGQHLYDAELHRLKGDLALARERTQAAEAEESFQRALELAVAQEAKSLELRAAASLARLRRDESRRDEARELLAPVYAWFTEGFGTRDLVDAKALLDELR
jgi:predicted ATPase